MNKNTSLIAMGATSVAVVAVVAVFAGYTWGNTSAAHTSTTASSVTLSSVADKASATSHNAEDGMFAAMMVEHHTQAIEMAKLAPTRARSPKVKELAAKIEVAQGPEIDKMSGWGDDWGTAVDTSKMHNRMDGMMSDGDMESLENSAGAAFDTMFLQMMIQHHTGAIKMANTELKAGKYGDALALATSIAVSQQGEITQMKALLN